MSEQQYEDNDTQPISLPRKGFTPLRRATFIEPAPAPPAWSRESSEKNRGQSLFEPLNPQDPSGARGLTTLAIGDKLWMPDLRDVDGLRPPIDAVNLGRYTVKGISFEEDGPYAKLETADGLQASIKADFAPSNGGLDAEAEIAKAYIQFQGIDIHDPPALNIEEVPEDS